MSRRAEPTDQATNVTREGKEPVTRIASAGNARDMANRILGDHVLEILSRSKVQGLLDGNSPYDPAVLQSLGRSWQANMNWREATAFCRTKTSAYWELTMEVPALIDVKLKLPRALRNSQAEYASIIAEEFTDTVLEWDQFYFHDLMIAQEMVRYGTAHAIFNDPWTWHFKHLKAAVVYMPDLTQSHISDYDVVVVRDQMKPGELWRIYNASRAERAGWNRAALREALTKTWLHGEAQGGQSQDRYQLGIWMSIQQRLKNNDAVASQIDFDPLRIMRVFVREMSGKVSHYIVPEDYDPSDFIYKREGYFDSMGDFLVPFFWDLGDGYVKSIRGLGHEVYPYGEVSNRFINTALDGGMLTGTLILQPTTTGSDEDLALTRFGPVTLLPKGLNAIQSSFQPKLDQMIGVRNMTQQILNNNTGIYKSRTEAQQGSAPITARQATIEAQNDARFEKNQATFYYTQRDAFMKQLFRRLMNPRYPGTVEGAKEAKAFQERLKDRGVPQEILDDPDTYCRVRAARGIGFGSEYLRDQATAALMSMAPTFPEQGAKNAVRDRVAAIAGYHNVDRYVPMGANMDKSEDDSIISLENNDLVEGKPVDVGAEQPHLRHLGGHLQSPVEIITQLRKTGGAGVDPNPIIEYFSQVLQHVQPHLVFALRNPNTRAGGKQMLEIIAEVKKEYVQLVRAAQQMAKIKDRQQKQQVAALRQAQGKAGNPELQAKLAEIEKKFQLDLYERRRKMDLREMQVKHTLALKDLSTASAIRREDAQARTRQESENE